MPKLRESTTAVIVRGEHVGDGFASEPYEAGWAIEAVLFLRLLEEPKAGGHIRVEISPDGMNWAPESDEIALPAGTDDVSFYRIAQFGNWLRLRLDLPEGGEVMLLATLHLKG